MRNLPDEKVEHNAPGEYPGQCRKVFNILEQWDGKKWRSVPHVIDRTPKKMGRLIFGPEDQAGDPYAGDRAFLPCDT